MPCLSAQFTLHGMASKVLRILEIFLLVAGALILFFGYAIDRPRPPAVREGQSLAKGKVVSNRTNEQKAEFIATVEFKDYHGVTHQVDVSMPFGQGLYRGRYRWEDFVKGQSVWVLYEYSDPARVELMLLSDYREPAGQARNLGYTLLSAGVVLHFLLWLNRRRQGSARAELAPVERQKPPGPADPWQNAGSSPEKGFEGAPSLRPYGAGGTYVIDPGLKDRADPVSADNFLLDFVFEQEPAPDEPSGGEIMRPHVHWHDEAGRTFHLPSEYVVTFDESLRIDEDKVRLYVDPSTRRYFIDLSDAARDGGVVLKKRPLD